MTPGTSEEDWLKFLVDIPAWRPPPLSTLVIAPHPDDETLGAGGFIETQRRRGCNVRVVAVTDGEAAYGSEDAELAELRRDEQLGALAELGVTAREVVRFGLPDSQVGSCEEELAARLEPLVGPDTLVIAPWEHDPHPDHEACGRAARRVVEGRGATLVSYFFWTWHWRDAGALASLPLVRLELDEAAQHARAAALAHHRSQLEHASGAPILPDLLLAPARRSFETFMTHGRAS